MIKSLRTLFEKLLFSNVSMFGSHISDTPSSLSFGVHKVDKKNLYDYQLVYYQQFLLYMISNMRRNYALALYHPCDSTRITRETFFYVFRSIETVSQGKAVNSPRLPLVTAAMYIYPRTWPHHPIPLPQSQIPRRDDSPDYSKSSAWRRFPGISEVIFSARYFDTPR